MNSLLKVLTIPLIVLAITSCGDNTEYLPVLGPRDVSNSGDTVYHIVPSFEFTSQSGESVSNKEVQNKVYCANFFFTTCRSICPKMNKNLAEVVRAYENENRIVFLSHSLDPKNDSPETLSAYAEGFGITTNNWLFLTGDEKKIYEQAGMGGYFVSARRDENSLDGIDHSGRVALVDRQGRIRAYHDLTDEENIPSLINDIEFLLNEAP